jgi:hypothetical protein
MNNSNNLNNMSNMNTPNNHNKSTGMLRLITIKGKNNITIFRFK